MFAVSLDCKNCKDCIHTCKDCFKGEGECLSFESGVDETSLKNINHELKRMNVDVRKFAKKNNLSFDYLELMLDGVCEMTYKTLYLLKDRLGIGKEWEDFLDRNPTGLCETNHFYEDSLMI